MFLKKVYKITRAKCIPFPLLLLFNRFLHFPNILGRVAASYTPLARVYIALFRHASSTAVPNLLQVHYIDHGWVKTLRQRNSYKHRHQVIILLIITATITTYCSTIKTEIEHHTYCVVCTRCAQLYFIRVMFNRSYSKQMYDRWWRQRIPPSEDSYK